RGLDRARVLLQHPGHGQDHGRGPDPQGLPRHPGVHGRVRGPVHRQQHSDRRALRTGRSEGEAVMSNAPVSRPGLISRLRRSRPVGKFSRTRPAVAALAVIALYVTVGVACFAGLITAEDAAARIGPDAVPGWLESRPPEKRLRDAESYRKLVQ